MNSKGHDIIASDNWRKVVCGIILISLLSFFYSCSNKRSPQDAMEAMQKRLFGKIPENIHVYISHETYPIDSASYSSNSGQAYIYASSISAACRALSDLMFSTQAGMFTPFGKRIHLPNYWPDIVERPVYTNVKIRGVDFSRAEHCLLWTWEEWESHLDFFALQGINYLLLPPGMGLSWLKTWEKFEVPEQHFSGAHPWLHPCFLLERDQHKSILNRYYKKSQEVLTKIIQRSEELGIRCAVEGFQGWIPGEMTQLKMGISAFPQHILSADTALYWLSPEAELYKEIMLQHLIQFEKENNYRPAVWFAYPELHSDKIPTAQLERECIAIHQTLDKIEKLTKEPVLIRYVDPEQNSFSGSEPHRKFCKKAKESAINVIYQRGDDKDILHIKGMCDSPLDGFRPCFDFNSMDQQRNSQSFFIDANLMVFDHVDLIEYLYKAWNTDKQEPDFGTYYCNARYGACNTSVLLALNLARKSLRDMRLETAMARWDVYRYISDLDPDFDWVQLRTRHLVEEQLDLALRLMAGEWDTHQDLLFFHQDLQVLANERLGLKLNNQLQLFLKNKMMGKAQTENALSHIASNLKALKNLRPDARLENMYTRYYYFAQDAESTKKWMERQWVSTLSKPNRRNRHEEELIFWNQKVWSEFIQPNRDPPDMRIYQRPHYHSVLQNFVKKMPGITKENKRKQERLFKESLENLMKNEL
jgi:hypothetical protein